MNRTENMRAEVRAALARYVDVVGELLAQEHPDLPMCRKWVYAHHAVDAAVMDYQLRDVQPKAVRRAKESLSLQTLPAKGGVKYPFIRAAAREMGVGIGHLWSALNGKPGFRDRAMLASRYKRIAARLMKDGRAPKAKPQFKGINGFAKQMGVGNQFARDVLNGKEKSGRIADAWKRFQKTEGAARA